MPHLAPVAGGQEAVVEVQEGERGGEREGVAAPEEGLGFGVDGVAGLEEGEVEGGLGVGMGLGCARGEGLGFEDWGGVVGEGGALLLG